MNKDYIYHFGIKGQRWGVRRFQNEDGTTKNKKKKPMNPRAKKALKVAGGLAAGGAVVATAAMTATAVVYALMVKLGNEIIGK